MTGEQKPGGLDGYPAWLETHRHTGEIRVALKRRADSPIMVSRWATIPLTPAEPAEARIRELVERVGQLQADFDDCNLHRAAAVQRATAAEAKLGNLLARIHRDGGHRQAEVGTDQAYEEAVIIIASALQQEGE